jgi:hypothetical protein
MLLSSSSAPSLAPALPRPAIPDAGASPDLPLEGAQAWGCALPSCSCQREQVCAAPFAQVHALKSRTTNYLPQHKVKSRFRGAPRGWATDICGLGNQHGPIGTNKRFFWLLGLRRARRAPSKFRFFFGGFFGILATPSIFYQRSRLSPPPEHTDNQYLRVMSRAASAASRDLFSSLRFG